ncbi:MAG TPA: hypothetical protein PKU93_01270 [Candidatus Pacearchaeota archaeon]|mgnify:CR=1 FL=1|nr:hypothetical protein [Candidatus Pacearchaeota archaeon]
MSLSNLSYVTGVNPQCPTDSITIMRNWTPKVCSAFGSCITGGVLFQNVTTAPTCTYQTAYGSNYVTCTSGGWTAAICAKVGQPLYNSEHTVDQCEFWNGTVVSDGVDTFCRFDSGVCPATWKQFKNWSTTIPATSGYPTYEWNVWAGTVYTGSHAWSNTARESYYCFYNSAKDKCVVGYNYGYGGETVYATTTQIGCY